MRLVIIEDIDEIRNGYQEFLSLQPEFESVDAFPSGEDFFDWLAKQSAMPGVVLTDIGLPGISGIDCIQGIKRISESTEVIMLTVYDDSDRIFKSLCAGATGYILKATPLNEIKTSILTIASGHAYMSPSIARKVMTFFGPTKKEETANDLTNKELEIVRGLVDGLSYKLIADKLNISINTVRQHIRNIYKKLQVNSKGEVISKSLKGEIN
ncbi:MAG: response regulator transcription factor [Bacteroidota bacterium]